MSLVLSATIPCKSASSVVEPSVLITVVLCSASSSPPPPVFRFPVVPLLSSDMSDYDFSQFSHWDGDSASYYEEYDHYTPPGPSQQSSQPRRLPSPLTPLASPSAFVQEFVQGSSTTGTQYEYTLTDIHELVYPDPPSNPTPSLRPVSAPPRIPTPPPHNQSRASTPPRIPTPDSPIDYECVAEQSPVNSTATDLPSKWENILPASFFQTPLCINSPEEHPHLYTAVYSAEGESWQPTSITVREHFSRIPLTPALARAFPVFPSVTPFRIPPPHLYTIFPHLIDPANANDFPPLYICSKAILDFPSVNLPLGSVRYDFHEGLQQAFAPLSNILRAGYIDSLVTLEVQDFLDGRVVTTYRHLRFTYDGQIFALYQGYFFEDLIRSNPLLLSHCLTPRVLADPFAFVPAIPDSHPL
ncbi:hypothetical protein EDB89DRAFT_1909952 [Lactarius sanguifluus]|nr:hypothetical protein EDB89DRAFT_1909952 [Lactarius sanguifluus]